jgi:S1-C subfamily serine protease
MRDFKIIIPQADADDVELDAIFEGRDERYNLAFVRAKDPSKQKWQPITFEDRPVVIGQPVMSVGVLPKAGGYRTYFAEAVVGAQLRGEVPLILVTGGGLAAIGSPVFDIDGRAIGFVNYQSDQPVFLNEPKNATAAISNPPQFFVPARDFVQSLKDPPTADKQIKLPWIGVPQLTGLRKDVAEYFGLENQPAVEVGDIIPNTPAERAGLKRGMIIVKLNGEPLERGDQPEELPQILRRKLGRMPVGSDVTFSVLSKRGEPLKDITLTFEEQPKRPNLAARFYADDLGFGVRDIVFFDTYARKLPADTKGVVVSVIKPQGAAQNARLQNNDLVTELNGQPVTDVAQFKRDYETFRSQKSSEAVVMVVIREANTQVIRIEPPQ